MTADARLGVGWRAVLGVAPETLGTERTERTESLAASESAGVLSFVSVVSGGVATRSAAQWRVRFELLAAERWHVDGYERDVARRRAFIDLAVEWTLAHPEVDALPSCEAEPIAVAALEVLGIREPKARVLPGPTDSGYAPPAEIGESEPAMGWSIV